METDMLTARDQNTERDDLVRQVKSFIQDQGATPVYVRNVMEKFGNDLENKDKVRSLVWSLVSSKDLRLGSGLALLLPESENHGR